MKFHRTERKLFKLCLKIYSPIWKLSDPLFGKFSDFFHIWQKIIYQTIFEIYLVVIIYNLHILCFFIMASTHRNRNISNSFFGKVMYIFRHGSIIVSKWLKTYMTLVWKLAWLVWYYTGSMYLFAYSYYWYRKTGFIAIKIVSNFAKKDWFNLQIGLEITKRRRGESFEIGLMMKGNEAGSNASFCIV